MIKGFSTNGLYIDHDNTNATDTASSFIIFVPFVLHMSIIFFLLNIDDNGSVLYNTSAEHVDHIGYIEAVTNTSNMIEIDKLSSST